MYKFKEGEMKIPCYVWSQEGSIEQGAIDQIKNASSLPFSFHHTVLCPDSHVGYGAPIGGVLATKGVVIVNFVGVDIGCGMCAVKTLLTEIDTETLKKIMGEIRKQIPLGMNRHKEKQDEVLMPVFDKLGKDYVNGAGKNWQENYLKDLGMPIVAREYNSALKSLGTLGGGNHFIEIQKGSDGHIWIMIHSGSRNLGKQVADYYNRLAYKLNKQWHSNTYLPPNPEDSLAFFPIDSEEGKAYLREMQYCVEFALANRKLMMERIKIIFENNTKLQGWCRIKDNGIDNFFPEFINIAHNYAKMENHFGENVMVHRKGATLATTDTIGIIPGSQGTKSYIVRGKGEGQSFNSCSHGAGRRLGRKNACRVLSLEEEMKKMEGIVHGMRNQKDLEEAPGSYKDIKTVMKNQSDLVETLVELTPLAVVKA